MGPRSCLVFLSTALSLPLLSVSFHYYRFPPSPSSSSASNEGSQQPSHARPLSHIYRKGPASNEGGQQGGALGWNKITVLQKGDTILHEGHIYTLAKERAEKEGASTVGGRPSSAFSESHLERGETLEFEYRNKETYRRSPIVLQGEETQSGDKVPPNSPQFWVYSAISLGLVILGGIMSGLTVGYFSIDELKLKLLTEGSHLDNPVMRQYAEAVKPVLSNHHLLLVTLLLTNAAAMEALPIFLNFLVPEYLAIILSVTFVLAFGEVIPQAICTKNPLKIGAKMAPITRLFMCITYPVSWPIAKLLDCILGEEGQWNYFRRSELKALIGLHEGTRGGNLLIDEVTIMQGALDLKNKTCGDIMTDFDEVFMVSMTRKLDVDTMAEIMTSGHSRVPVYSGRRNNVEGLLLVKRLIVVDPDDERPISQFIGYHLPIVLTKKTNLLDALNLFQIGRSHMALVVDTEKDVKELVSCLKIRKRKVPESLKIRGILTIEDVIEELINEDIDDETDIAFATKEFYEDFKGVRKAVDKFKELLRKSKARRAGGNSIIGTLNTPRRKAGPRIKLKKLVSSMRIRKNANASPRSMKSSTCASTYSKPTQSIPLRVIRPSEVNEATRRVLKKQEEQVLSRQGSNFLSPRSILSMTNGRDSKSSSRIDIAMSKRRSGRSQFSIGEDHVEDYKNDHRDDHKDEYKEPLLDTRK